MAQISPQVPVFPRNQFMLEEYPIGRGGYGTVFRGQHTKLGIVAIKTLIDTGLLPQKHLLALQKEAEKLRGVCQHPSILNLHGIITEKNNYSLVLEYMPLGSATDFRKDFPVQWPLIVQIIRDLVDGMTFLHEHQPTILHLDLKGDNILLDKLCRAKISDFGLSEWKTITMTVTRGGGGGGQESSRKCTVTHVPPEVWSNVNLPADKYYDIYSFGIVIWELLSGQFPYRNASEELIRSSVLSGQRPDFSLIDKQCPMFLTKMMTKCWHQKPTQRPHFKDLRPEIDNEFAKNYKKHVVKSLKSVRREITGKYPSTDPVYIFTNEIDVMVEPVVEEEPEEPTPSTSHDSNTTPKVVTETPAEEKQPEPAKVEPREFPKSLYKKLEDLSNEEKEVRKVLFSPTACRLLHTRHFKDIFKICEETCQILKDPITRRQYIESDETLARQVKYSKCNAFTELDGDYYKNRNYIGDQFTRANRRDFNEKQSKSYNVDRMYGGSYDEKTTRGARRSRARQGLDNNPTMKKLKNGGSLYKVKSILDKPEVLRQALEDKKKGVSNPLQLVAIDNESLDLLRNPFLLMMVFTHEYDIRRKYNDDDDAKNRDLYTWLFANATYTGEFPTGGYKLPDNMKDMMPYWLEGEMLKQGFDVDNLSKTRNIGQSRSHFGMYGDSDDDDFDDYPPMRSMSRRMMGMRDSYIPDISKKMSGYELRRMVSEIEDKANRTELAKKVMRIISRPSKEERDKEREKNKDKKDKKDKKMKGPRYPDMAMGGVDPMEMMMRMRMDPNMDDKMLMRNIMRMEEMRMMQMRAKQGGPDNSNIRISPMLHRQSLLKRKSPQSPTSSTPSATVSKPDLETDAAGSMPTESTPSGETGPTNPSDPKKSKSDGAEATDKNEQSSVSSAKDGSVEIEHKHSGVLGGITKLFFGKNTKLPNMQVGDRNVMRIGGHHDDSDDDMPDSNYDKSYKPPSSVREPNKFELDKICNRIHGDYRNLGRQLKLQSSSIEQIVQDYKPEGMHEVAYQMIKKWQEVNGSEATNVVLSDALHKMRRDDLSKHLRN